MHKNAVYDLQWPFKVHKAIFLAKTEVQYEQGGSRESEKVRETVEDYLDWHMNRAHYEITDKMDELEDSLEKDCS